MVFIPLPTVYFNRNDIIFIGMILVILFPTLAYNVGD